MTPPGEPRLLASDPDVALTLPANPTASAAAREALRALARERGLEGERVADAALMISELVSNAVEHASGPDDDVLVRLTLHAGTLSASVSDRGRGVSVPQVRSPDFERGSGHGLFLVDN